MNFTAHSSVDHVLDHDSQVKICFLPEKFTMKKIDPAIIEATEVDLKSFFADCGFTGKKETTACLPIAHNKKVAYIIFVGLGDKDESGHYSIESFRRGLGSAAKYAKSRKASAVSVALPSHLIFKVRSAYLAEQVAIIVSMAWYSYDRFIGKKEKEAKNEKEKTVQIFATPDKSEDVDKVEEGLGKGLIVAESVNRARSWVDTPPSHLTPTDLANHAETLAAKYKMKCTIFEKDEIIKQGMGGLHGVSRGSSEDPRFVILEYKSKKKNAPTLGFVGKGITFDSGGLSLKPPAYMEDMKEDMAGAASVINAIAAVAQLKLDVNIVAFAAITENLPGQSALKPGDIITFYNGKTAEVKNTDAEGRLVLADALSYAVANYELDGVVDVATLTGACIYAVGPFYSALLSDNDYLAGFVKESGEFAGDYVWRLPFNDDFKKAIKSKIADIQNIGSKAIAAGTITAACFLRNFSGDTPWAHLDIASSGYKVPHVSYYDGGATGSSVRLLIELASRYSK